MFKKVLKAFAKLISLTSKNSLTLQSIIFWIAAIVHVGQDRFWFFAIPAIVFSGLQSIVDELKTINKNN
jgi:hypothetical protein|tara:strand:- start:1781 stop:1987 length:207 start_codon:yes stop_codon:yes gene_type:complete